jgi:hypothetical protein
MGNDKLGAKDFFVGCLVVGIAIIVVPILILIFKVSIYLAIIIAIFLAIILGMALLGRVIRLIFFRNRSLDKKDITYRESNHE